MARTEVGRSPLETDPRRPGAHEAAEPDAGGDAAKAAPPTRRTSWPLYVIVFGLVLSAFWMVLIAYGAFEMLVWAAG